MTKWEYASFVKVAGVWTDDRCEKSQTENNQIIRAESCEIRVFPLKCTASSKN